jgi:hypothetical protein
MSSPFDGYLSHLPPEHREALAKEIARTTKVVHKPIVTPATATPQPGLGPLEVAIGTAIGLSFSTPATDRAYRSFKIDNDFIGSPSFHVHWTKGDDTNQSGNTVRWQIDYHVFNGRDQDISNGSITTLIVDDTYDDAGSTTRVVHRTQNIDASNFTAGYYVGLAIKVVPGSTTVVNPTLITVDLITDIAIE